jgi:sugar O-acyltransferase (sialic acid O-acetyltransferase NeuD family)
VATERPKIVIYGNGAMARVLHSYARRGMDVCGFTVDDACIAEEAAAFCDVPLVPFSRVQESFDPTAHRMIVAVGFAEMNELRERKSDEARRKGYSFASYVHESCCRHDGVAIGENCVILEHVSIHPGSSVGDGTFICGNVNIGHDCTIGPYNWINAGVSIAGGCRVGPGGFFGVNASVGQGVALGARNFIAANTLVTKTTGDDEVYLSAPGQLFRLKSKAFLKFSRMQD